MNQELNNERDADKHILINEEASDTPGYHKYVIKSAMTTQHIEGAASYFTKYRNMLIITIEHDLNDKLNRLLASAGAPSM